MGTDKRERQKQARQAKIEDLRRQEERSASRRRTMLIGGAVVAFVAFAIGFSILTADDGDQPVATDDPTDEVDGDTGTDDSGTDDTDDPATDDADTDTPAPETTANGVIAGTEACPGADAEPTIDFSDTFQDCLEAGVDYQARFVTTEGDVVVDLREAAVPTTVNNFVALARYGYYDETLLFRTDPSIDIIQGGSPHTQDNRDPGPGYTIPDEGGTFEVDAQGQYIGPFSYEEGQLIMARSAGPDSSSAQFFFSTGPNVSLLDGQGTYLLFGDVTEGLDVLQAIMGLHEDDPENPLGGGPSRDVTIERVEILEA